MALTVHADRPGAGEAAQQPICRDLEACLAATHESGDLELLEILVERHERTGFEIAQRQALHSALSTWLDQEGPRAACFGRNPLDKQPAVREHARRVERTPNARCSTQAAD